jgi:hypothetical protein
MLRQLALKREQFQAIGRTRLQQQLVASLSKVPKQWGNLTNSAIEYAH